MLCLIGYILELSCHGCLNVEVSGLFFIKVTFLE